MSGTVLTWAFFIVLMGASAIVAIKLQNIYNERGK
ncbi:hypothetical protein HNP25_004311 [Arcicella rosea]|uniref:Uncharacterized protein n=1 Tax=Arcicella rosea TaxID=502909 RepID=A0A841ENH4_9BACT|nr:hypothetical protein [Arcicella rosea]